MSIPSFAGLLLVIAGSDTGDMARPISAPPTVQKGPGSSQGWRRATTSAPAVTSADASSSKTKFADSSKWRDVVVLEPAYGAASASTPAEEVQIRPELIESRPRPLAASKQPEERFEPLPRPQAAQSAVTLAAGEVDVPPGQTVAPEPIVLGNWRPRRAYDAAASKIHAEADPLPERPAPMKPEPLASADAEVAEVTSTLAADPPPGTPPSVEIFAGAPLKVPPADTLPKALPAASETIAPGKPDASTDPFPRSIAGAENSAAAPPKRLLADPWPKTAPGAANAPAPVKSGTSADPFPRNTAAAPESNGAAKPTQPTRLLPQEEIASSPVPMHGAAEAPAAERTSLAQDLSPAVEEWTNWTGGERSFLLWSTQPPGRTVATGPSSISTSELDYPARFGQEFFLGRRFDTSSGFEGGAFFADNASRGAELNRPAGVSLPFTGPHAGDFQQLDAVRIHASSNFWSASASWVEYWSGCADGTIRGRLLFGPRFLGITERFGFEADKAGATGAYAVKTENSIFAGEVGLGGSWNVTPDLKLDLLGKYAAGGNVYNVEQQMMSPGGGFAYNNATRVSRFATIAELNAEADWRVRRGCHLILGYRLWRIDQVARATSQLSFDSNDMQPSASTNGSLLAQGIFVGARFFWGAAVDPSCRSGVCRPYVVNLD